MRIQSILLPIGFFACVALADRGDELRSYRADPDAVQADIAHVVATTVEQTNAFRKTHDLPEITMDKQLAATAQDFADYMAKELKYGHECDGRTPAERAEAHKYEYCIVLENIAFTFNSRGIKTAELSAHFVQGWIDSPPHRKNMLDPDATQIGVGIARSDNGVYFGVQVLGRPKSAMINIKIENKSKEPMTYTLLDKQYALAPRTIRTHGMCRFAAIKFDVPKGSKLPTDEKLAPTKSTTFVIVSRGDVIEIRAN